MAAHVGGRNITFGGVETRSAHKNGTYGDNRVYTFFEAADNTVGASLLTMNPRTQRGIRHPALSLTTIASKLAPTVLSAASKNVYTRLSP